jgi:hypothetical protein
MPTYDVLASFWRDWGSLTRQQQRAFREAVAQFIADLRAGKFRPSLRIKRVQGYAGVWELSWAPTNEQPSSTGTRSAESRTSFGGASGHTTSSVARDSPTLAYPPRTRSNATNEPRKRDGYHQPLEAKEILRMELGGLEPPTSWVRSRRSPN